MTNTGCSFLCIVLLSEALVKQAWWWWNLWVLAYLRKNLFFLHLRSLVWLDMWFWVENSLRILNIDPHSLLVYRVSAERSAVSLMGFPLWVTRPFSLAALSILSFRSTLVNLTIICFGIAVLEEYLCGVLCITWSWVLSCVARLGKFSWIISWRVFSSLDSFSSSYSGAPIKCKLGVFT